MVFAKSLFFVIRSEICHQVTSTRRIRNFRTYFLLLSIVKTVIIWLANFASFDWSILGPITYGTDPDGPVTFAFFCFCFICTLFELVTFTNEMAITLVLIKEALGLG